MMVVIARWTVQAESINTILDLLPALQKASRAEPGCLTYDYYQDPKQTHNILIYEEYKNAEAIEAHRMSPHFQDIAVKQILPRLELRTVKVFEQPPV